jgi:predicted dehydrogenase
MPSAADASIAIERVGIVGAGAAASAHLSALRHLHGKRIVAICDTHHARAARLAADCSLPESVAMDPCRFYEDGKPQIVHVVTPPHLHENIASEALTRGVHVLVEKPPALTVEGCRSLQARAACRSVTIGVNENTALGPLILKAARVIAERRLGGLAHIDGYYSFGIRADDRLPNWIDWLPGGMLEDLLPHLLTIARTLAGGRLIPRYWHLVSTGRVAGQKHDELRLFLSNDKDLTVNLALSLTEQPKALAFAVRGTEGALAIDVRNGLFSFHPGPPGPIARRAQLIGSSLGAIWQTIAYTAGFLVGYRERFGSSLYSIRAHYAALETGQAIPAPLSRGIETVEIVRSIWPL